MKPADAIQIIAAETQKLENMPLTPEKKASGRTYLDILKQWIALPGEENRVNAAPYAIRERKREEVKLHAAQMNQDLMFIIRRMRREPPELLEEMHANFQELVWKFPNHMTGLENYDNWIGGVTAELATIEALQKLNCRYHLGSEITKLSPEDDVGKNKTRQKMDFSITKPDGIMYGFQVKSHSGADDDYIDIGKSADGLPEVQIECAKREHFFDLTRGEYNSNFESALINAFIDFHPEKWRF
jgi:hypothetical protein